MFRDCTHAEEHEDDCFRTTAQHFHSVLDGCVRFQRNVGFYVILHCYSTECDPFNQQWIINDQ